IHHLRKGNLRSARIALAATAAAFAFLFFFLTLRGKATQACPLNTLPDALAFLGWSILLLAFATGLSFHIHLLGAFTAPLVILLLLPSVFARRFPTFVRLNPLDPWVEFHAALSLVAYGAFGIAAVAAVLYLVQENNLKSHRFGKTLFLLPPITELTLANARMTDAGIFCLTISFIAGYLSNLPIPFFKLLTSCLIWLFFAASAFLRYRRKSTPRLQAILSIACFLLALISFPIVHFLSVLSNLMPIP
ncbi:MAG: cytochrome c biogenesis protein, partial [Chthoniobacterales bacterium]|nr:cytochrome c biogenesis protein [Chthoniobacterales bacterium]